MEVLDGDRTFTVNAESGFHISKGTLHAWRNATTKPARTLLFIAPAGFEEAGCRERSSRPRRFPLDKSTIFVYLPWIHRRFIAASYADRVVQGEGAALGASSEGERGEGGVGC